jgi:hypothetical protein
MPIGRADRRKLFISNPLRAVKAHKVVVDIRAKSKRIGIVRVSRTRGRKSIGVVLIPKVGIGVRKTKRNKIAES